MLEHVYDIEQALREAVRVLRPGGAMLFTVPFFPDRDQSLLRGRPAAGGGVEHLAPPEYHGDGMSKTGIYTSHNLGWDLLDRVRDAGFARVEVGICHAPQEGFAAADPMALPAWLKLPMVFYAIR